MRALFDAFGIDYAQWKALTIAGLRVDLRAGTFGGARTKRKARVSPIVMQLIVYLVFGVFVAVAVSWIADLFLASLVVTSYVMFMVGTAMLVDHNATITSPTHYAVLAFQPIASQTWFAARVANVLAYVLGMTAAVSLLPACVLFVRRGVLVGAATVLAVFTCAITVTLAITIAYASIMRRIGVQRLRSVLSYVQIVTGLVLYGAFFLFTDDAAKNVLTSLELEKTPLLLLYPGTWYASWIELAAGRAGATEIVPTLVSLLVLGLLALAMRGRLSMDHAERLGALATATSTPRARASARRPAFWFRTGEARAVAILVRAQFRNDLKFRMGVLGAIPLTIVYLYMGLREAGGNAAGPGDNLTMITLAVLLFPAIIRMQLGRSDAFRASWVFFTTPADRTRLIRSSKNVLVVYFLLPYLAFVGGLLVWLTGSIGYVALYLILVGLVSHLALVFVTFLDPELPFSKPVTKGGSTGNLFATMIGLGVFGAFLPAVLRRLHGNALASVIAFGVIVLVTLFVDRMMRLRVERQAAELEFEG